MEANNIMKELVESLERSLISRGKTFDITGKELMELYHTTESDCKYLDLVCVIAPIQYAKEIGEIFELRDEVQWYFKNDNEPKHITSSLNEICYDCYDFMTFIFREGNLKGFTMTVVEYVNKIKNIARDEEIYLSIACLDNKYFRLDFKNGELFNVDIEDMVFDISDIDCVDEILRRLMIYSYDVPLKETLSILRLI